MSIHKKSLTELRGIAQSFGVEDIFKKDITHLVQAIELKQKAMIPAPVVAVPKPEYDARLMMYPPAKKTDQELLEEYSVPYKARGVKITYDNERWYASFDKRNDQGTLRMPPRHFMKCLDKLLEPVRG